MEGVCNLGLGIGEVVCTSACACQPWAGLGTATKEVWAAAVNSSLANWILVDMYTHRKKCANTFDFIWCIAQLRLVMCLATSSGKCSRNDFSKPSTKSWRKKCGVGFFLLFPTDRFHGIHSFHSFDSFHHHRSTLGNPTRKDSQVIGSIHCWPGRAPIASVNWNKQLTETRTSNWTRKNDTERIGKVPLCNNTSLL